MQRLLTISNQSERVSKMVSMFIDSNCLQEADVVIARKRGWGIFEHFIIYLGRRFGQHLFVANDAADGVCWFTGPEILELIKDFSPVKIRRFNGNAHMRRLASTRAEQEIGKSYSLTEFNCEHLANYVQYGIRESKQVDGWKTSLTIAASLLFVAILFGE
jgi:hypothetical protein